MFGYLRPFKDELKVKDYQLYKSVYCGLCKSMKKEYGLLSTLMLSYDCTVLAMLCLSVNDEKYCVRKGRCTVNPLKKCSICKGEGWAFSFAGAVSVIMTRYKLNDTILDSGFLKKLAAFFLRLVFHGNYKRALKAYPEIDSLTAAMMESQAEAERNNAGIDRSADPTATLIKKLCGMISPGEAMRHQMEVFGYFVGRWIYLIDAADDVQKDMKHHNFNPFAAKYQGDIKATMGYCNEVLNMTASQMILSYELLELHSFKAILDNIVYDGLSYQQKKYTIDKYNEKNSDNKRGN